MNLYAHKCTGASHFHTNTFVIVR